MQLVTIHPVPLNLLATGCAMALSISDIKGQALMCHQELQQFVLSDVSLTGRLLGSGSYGTVEEVSCLELV